MRGFSHATILIPRFHGSARKAWDHDALLCHKYQGKKTPCRLWVSLLTQARLISSYWCEQPFVGEERCMARQKRLRGRLPSMRLLSMSFNVLKLAFRVPATIFCWSYFKSIAFPKTNRLFCNQLHNHTTKADEKGLRWRKGVGSDLPDFKPTRTGSSPCKQHETHRVTKSTLSFKRKILKFGVNLFNIEQETAI